MDYADTNFLVAAYFQVPTLSESVERFLRRQRRPLVVGELAELECRGVFIRKEQQSGGDAWEDFQARLDRGEWRREPVAWERLTGRTKELQDKYVARLPIGSFDLLHVAAALVAGCSGFLSLDTRSNARVLAACARLKVWPELSAAEKSRLVR
jgi:predicted nucleic acid-binding protein